jgi:hypothetical protein
MLYDASDLARHLARNAEAVCRHYLSNGCREGRYWLVGDIRNAPGRSLYVRLIGGEGGKGTAGKWTDAATGEHGDLLDIIRASCDLKTFREVAEEAQRFLSLPRPEPPAAGNVAWAAPKSDKGGEAHPGGVSEAARRLFKASRPIRGTLAESYLRQRGITGKMLASTDALRFHPNCFYRTNADAEGHVWPALIAAVTDLDGTITGVHRTWLDLLGRDKAPVDTPRRAMGHLLGHAVRFGHTADVDVLAAGEGIETVLSLRCGFLPHMPMMAALSAAHLAALLLPRRLRCLYIIRDADPAGDKAAAQLADRAVAIGSEVRILSPRLGDFNEDLLKLGTSHVRANVRAQLSPEDQSRFFASLKDSPAAS